MVKITKQDFQERKRALALTALYTFVLAAVYCYFAIVKHSYVWVCVLIPVVIFIIGSIFFFCILQKNAKKRIEEREAKRNVKIN